jgi:TatA/E family protein of Tat protein translocase
MFGPFDGFEIVVLLALGLMIFGPRRLPEIGRTLGKALFEFRRAAAELKTSIEREIDLEEVHKATGQIQKQAAEVRDSVARGVLDTKKAFDKAVGGDLTASLDDARNAIEGSPEPPPGDPKGTGGGGAGN